MLRKFISFKTEAEREQEKRQESLKKEVIDKIIALCGESTEIENELQNEFDSYKLRNLITTVDRSCKSILDSLKKYNASLGAVSPTPKNNTIFNGVVPITGTTSVNSFLSPDKKAVDTSKDFLESAMSNDELINKMLQEKIKKAQETRTLDNGGLAPPRTPTFQSLKEIDLSSKEKKSLVEEMKSLHKNGITVNKTTFHHKPPMNMGEFTEPFKFLENMHDYNGPFIISLLKTQQEVGNQSIANGIDLTGEIKNCVDGKSILISVYDITGSVSNGEQKRFVISLSFDKINGVINYDKALFPVLSSGAKLSIRQIDEVKKLCISKKIAHGTIR